jgi:RHS repeat-associated protein
MKNYITRFFPDALKIRNYFKPLIQTPIVLLIFMLHTVYTSAQPVPMGFDANDLRIVITPDHFPIIWRDAQKYGTDFTIGSVYDTGVYACSTYCPQAALDAGAVYYKEFNVPGRGTITVYYDANGKIVGTSPDEDLDNDGIPDTIDPDRDNDGVSNGDDLYPDDPSKWANSVVGELEGEFGVSPSGSATYSIPVYVSPGIAGMQPMLNLSYNSSAGNDLLGLGWSLGGLSSITRCPQTPVYDGAYRGVQFDNTDRYCLDGQRLLLVTGTEGSNGSEYRTEIESFRRVTVFGNTGYGPQKFLVETKSGKVLEYGYTDDSRIEAQGKSPAVAVWALNKVLDKSGNYLLVEYLENYTIGEYYPLRIKYTGHEGTASITPFNTITFNYENRLDNKVSYQAGSKTTISKRLNKIETPAGKYVLMYKEQDEKELSRLDKVYRCDNQNNCLEPTIFSWDENDESSKWVSANNHLLPVPLTMLVDFVNKDNGVRFADINGDGLTDILYSKTSDTGKTWINTPTGWDNTIFPVPPSAFVDSVGNDRGVRLLDLDGDGLQDVIRGYTDQIISPPSYVPDLPNTVIPGSGAWRNTGTGWEAMNSHKSPVLFASASSEDIDISIRIGDLNGDGRDDIYAHAGTPKAFLNLPSGWVEAPNYNPPQQLVTSDGDDLGVRYIDLNGDGKLDVVSGKLFYSTTLIDVHCPDQTETYPYCSGQPVLVYSPPVLTVSSGAWLNNGNGYDSEPGYSLPGGFVTSDLKDNGLEFADMNGDGLPDLLLSNQDEKRTWMNTGSGWEETSKYVAPVPFVDSENKERGVRLIDLNGDGRTDIIRSDTSDVIRTVTVCETGDHLYYGYSCSTQSISGLVSDAWIQGNSGTWLRAPEYQPDSEFSHQQKILGGTSFLDLNGNGMPDIVHRSSSSIAKVNITKKMLITGIANGLGAEKTVAYNPISNSVIYTKCPTAGYCSQTAYPEQNFQGPIYVVTRATTENGLGGVLSNSYKYEGMKYHLDGYGSLGFAKVTITDEQTGIQEISSYRQDYPYVGSISHSETRSTSNQLLNEQDFTYAYSGTIGSGPVFPFASQSMEKDYDYESGTLLTTVTKTTTFDNYGNALTSNAITTGGGKTFSQLTMSVYDNDVSNWQLGKISRVTATTTGADGVPMTRTSSFDSYHPVTEAMLRTTIEPDNTDPDIKLVTVYTYDEYGNQTSKTSCDGSISTCQQGAAGSRTTTQSYTSNSPNYPDGLFVTTVSNALGQPESYVYNAKYGSMISMTDPNGIVTSWIYDGLGRKTKETRADGTYTNIKYLWCNTNCPTVGGISSKYKIMTESLGTPANIVYLDKLGREIRRESSGFNGTQVYVDTHYDNQGRVLKTSSPYFSYSTSSAVFWITPTYDDFDRQIELTYPKEDETYLRSYTDYDGFQLISTDAKNRNKTITKNAIGETVSVVDAQNGIIKYKYDALGNLVETEDAAGNKITLSYDIRGRKIAMSDPDMGAWSYSYNAFGNLVAQTDAKGQTVTMEYDALGRMTSRIEPEGESQWIYGNDGTSSAGNRNIGRLIEVKGYNDEESRLLQYDTLGRPKSEMMAINPGTPFLIGGQSYTTEYAYYESGDQIGKLRSVTYPEVNNSNFKVERNYNSLGYLSEIRQADSGAVLWKAEEVNARGQVERILYGNGALEDRLHQAANGFLDTIVVSNAQDDLIYDMQYGFDEVGNIKWREDRRQQLQEKFTYDTLDRLTDYWVEDGNDAVAANTNKDVQYDLFGNITYKSDIGHYKYGNDCQTGFGPHAVCEIRSAATGGALLKSYAYDANGSLTNGAGREIEYTSFNKPWFFKEGTTEVKFRYGADRSRIVRVAGSKQTVYVGLGGTGNPLYQREVDSNQEKHIHYIYADGQSFAAHVVINNNSVFTNHKEYYHRDHLGSIEVVTFDSAVSPVYFSHDPWGERRNPQTWVIDGSAQPAITGNIGFTGHEAIPEIGLVHMNGRVYDPVLGKFLSADPNIQSTGNLQNYNRYTYVLNNPLSYADPSGYFFKRVHEKTKSFNRRLIDRHKDIHDELDDFRKRAENWAIRHHFRQHEWVKSHEIGILNRTDDYIAEHKWAQIVVTIIASYFGGPIGSTIASMHIAYCQGATTDQIRRVGTITFITSVASAGIDAHFNGAYPIERVFAQVWLSGAAAMASGGDVAEAMKRAAITSGANSVYQNLVGYEASPEMTTNPANPGRPVAEWFKYDEGVQSTQHIDSFGSNVALIVDKVTNKPVFLANFLTQGGAIRFANYIPGFSAISKLHDAFQIMLGPLGSTLRENVFLNVGGMIIAAPISYAALMDNVYLNNQYEY